MGAVANVVQSLKLPDGNIKVLVEGVDRARVIEWKEDKGFYRVVVKVLQKMKDQAGDVEQTMSRVVSLFEQYVKLSNNLHYDAMIAAVRVDDPGKLADTIAAHLLVGVDEKQNLLEIVSPLERLNRIASILEAEVDKLQVDRRIQSRVKKQMEKAQKEYYLNEKMKAIQKELGRKDEKGNEIEELRKKIDQSRMPKDIEEKAVQELKRLESMPPMSAEATVSRNYLDWLIAVPWHKKTKENRDLKNADKVLNEDHYGLEKIKDRILEFLAVRALVKKPKATILTFVGPPGVGKTSLAKSIARAMNRKFVRLSLGGVRDEAEIRGHRRTYIGAFPGQIIQMMKKAGLAQPGVPARRSRQDVDGLPRRPVGGAARSARPRAEQRVPRPLPRRRVRPLARHVHLHRQRAAHHPAGAARPHGSAAAGRLHRAGEGGDRQALPGAEGDRGQRPHRQEHRLRARTPSRPSSSATRARPASATSSAKSTRSAARWRARSWSRAPRPPTAITADKVTEYLGVPRYRPTVAEEQNEIGIATGLAWTEVGGEILITEATLMPGRGKLTLTGKLGDVMQESAQAAMSFVRSRAEEFGIQKDFNRKLDVHVHIPEGAIPKDGPSAGITLATALISALARIPARRDVAMTGEITLRGQGAADRRRQGEGPRRAPRRGQDHPGAEGQREGPRRHPEERARRAGRAPGQHDGRGAQDRARRAADAAAAIAGAGARSATRRTRSRTRVRFGEVLRFEVNSRSWVVGSERLSSAFILASRGGRRERRQRLQFVTSAADAEGFPNERLPELAMVGRSNVGKSSLINALVRQTLARTSAAPGKTRLANFYRVEAEGRPPFYLVDLPGYGYARGGDAARRDVRCNWPAAYFAAGRGATLLLVDSRHPDLDADARAWTWLVDHGVTCHVVATKLDKLTQAERRRHLGRTRASVLRSGDGRLGPDRRRTGSTVDTDRNAAAAATANGTVAAEPATLDLSALKELSVAELTKVARELDIPHATGLRKQELIFEILRGPRRQGRPSSSPRACSRCCPTASASCARPTTTTWPGPDDIYVSPSQIRKFDLHTGDTVAGQIRSPKEGERYFALIKVEAINFEPPARGRERVFFENLTPLYPQEHIRLEADPENLSTRVMDMMTPLGKGQRGLIVAPPRTGKTMLMQSIANAITINHPEVYLIVLLIDERPEEVTDMQRSVQRRGGRLHLRRAGPAPRAGGRDGDREGQAPGRAPQGRGHPARLDHPPGPRLQHRGADLRQDPVGRRRQQRPAAARSASSARPATSSRAAR